MVKTQTSRVSQNSKAKCPVLDRFYHPPLHHLHFGAKASLKAPLWPAGMSANFTVRNNNKISWEKLVKLPGWVGKLSNVAISWRFRPLSQRLALLYRDEVETHGISRAFILISGTQKHHTWKISKELLYTLLYLLTVRSLGVALWFFKIHTHTYIQTHILLCKYSYYTLQKGQNSNWNPASMAICCVGT